MPSIPTLDDLPATYRDRIVGAMGDEQLVWLGKPNPGSFAKRMWKYQVSGLVGLGFAWFWYTTASDIVAGAAEADPDAAHFPYFALVPAAIAVAMLGSPWLAKRSARHVVYALTSGRALIVRPFLGVLHPRSFKPADLQHVELRQRDDGSGDVIFDRSQTPEGAMHGRPAREIGFLGVDDVASVHALVVELAATADQQIADA